jgi:hypothetical protein
VRSVRLDEDFRNVVLDHVERGVEHLLRIDARRIDIAILDAKQRPVEDLQGRQVMSLDTLCSGSSAHLGYVQLERDDTFGRLTDDGEDER